MCNAMNHHPGCDCGFGPKEGRAGDPLPQSGGRKFQGRIKRGPRKSWGEQAASNEAILRNGLLEAGASEQAIRKALRDYHKEGLPLGRKSFESLEFGKRRDIVNTIKRLVGIRKYKIEEKKTRTIKVPLFTFGAPDVDNSKVTYEESTDFKNERGWAVSLIVPGIGMGASQEFETEYSIKYSCQAGKFKTIFAPIRLRIYKLGIYEKGVRVKDGGIRITAEGGKLERNFQRGVRPCHQPECTRKTATFDSIFYDASNDPEDISLKTQQWAFKKPIEVNVGLNVFGIQMSAKAKVALQKKIKLQYMLPGGYNYHLYRLKQKIGITWKTFKRRGRKKQRARVMAVT